MMRISKRLFLGFAIVICISVVVGVMGITGMNRLSADSLAMYENQVVSLEYTGRVTASFKQLRIDCRQVVISSFYDDHKGAVDAKVNFEKGVEDFRFWLDECLETAATDELVRFYTRIHEIFCEDYLPKAELLIRESIDDMPEHTEQLYVNVLLASLYKEGARMESLMMGSMDLNMALVEQTNNENERYTFFLVIIQSSLLVLAVIVAATVAVLITRSISKPIGEAAQVLSKIADGDFHARVQGDYNGDFALIKNSVNETAMRLSIYVAEKLQEDKIRKLAAIVAVADAGIIVMDKYGYVREWNVGAENILGYKAEEAIGHSTHHYAPEENHAEIDEIDGRVAKGEHIAHVAVVRKRKDGGLINVSASYTPIFDENGNFAGSVVIFHDITREKRAEEKARSLAAIVAIADAGIVVKDKDGIVLDWNIGAQNILGYQPEEMIGRTTHFYAPEESHAEIDEIDELLRDGENIVRLDVVRKHKDGTLIDCSASFTPIIDDNGFFDGSVAIFHDISDKKQMELALKDAVLEAEEKHQTIMASLDYARKIQESLLAKESVFRKAFSDYSLIWKPRDTVGGDIYWIKSYSGGTVLCVCDCTGHGTPGALLTMLVVSAFEDVVDEENHQNTAQIVWELEQRLVSAFNVNKNSRGKVSELKDGCDLAVLFIAKDGSVTISGGNIHVFVCDGSEVRKIRGQRIFVGEGRLDGAEDVAIVTVPADPRNKFYIASDGLYDQVGGKYDCPFGYTVFKKIILDNHHERQAVISHKIWDAFEIYRGNQPRRDDMQLITFKPR